MISGFRSRLSPPHTPHSPPRVVILDTPPLLCCVRWACAPVNPARGMADKQLFDAVATGDANYLAALLSRKKGGLSSKNRVRGWVVLEGLHASHHVACQYLVDQLFFAPCECETLQF